MGLALAGDGVRGQRRVEDAVEESRLLCFAWLAAVAWQRSKERDSAIPAFVGRGRGVEFASSWKLLSLNDGALLEELAVKFAVLEPMSKSLIPILTFELTLALCAAVVGCEEMSWVYLWFCSGYWWSS